MTKIVNKKIITLLMAVIFIACTAIVPVSAAEIVPDSTFGGFEITYLGDDDSPQAMAVDSISGNAFKVYPATIQDGQYAYAPEWYESATGTGYTPYNFTLSSQTSADMSTLGWKYLIIELTFTVKGSNLTRYELQVNGSTYSTGNIVQAGTYTISWVVPKAYSTYGLTVYATSLNSNYLGGHISIS